ncbi:DUF5694 domain-containing protein [Dokdonella sp.]|uniref:DUF5694 domain-containing protein n=1 Tax=Dokdonella sp. TaxID=2291710 RepID=UPI0035290022
MSRAATAFLSLILATTASAGAPVEVMILGTYHMGNPGLDLHNMKADDVLAPERQKQLKDVVDSLARFRPNRVAVERNADDQPNHTVPVYHDYLAGERQESRNEIDQIAFRLAKKLNLAEVHGIDVDGNFPYEAVEAFAKKAGRYAELEQASSDVEKRMQAFSARQQTSTIGQLLYSMNTAQAIRDDSSFYMNLLFMGDGKTQPGAELVGQWTMRNLQICARLAQMVEPGDRVIVVYGAGHSALLRQCASDMPDWKLIEPNDFLPH